MPLFFYRARDANNQEREGVIDALSLQHARDLLRSKGLFTEEIHEATMKDQGIKKAFVLESNPEVRPADDSRASKPKISSLNSSVYYPLSSTLRLYAGWLLAWYGLIFAIGAYQTRGILPFHSQLIAGLASSTIVLASAFGVFLFLMLSSLYKTLHAGLLKGAILTIVWVLGLVWFGVNI